MAVRQIMTGWDQTAFEIREGEGGIWEDGIFIGYPGTSRPKLKDLRAFANQRSLKQFLAVFPGGILDSSQWKTYPYDRRE